MESCERATSDFFSAMSSSKGYWYSLLYFYDTTFSLSQLFVIYIDEQLDVFEIIGFVKKFEKKGSQFMRFKITNFINQNGLDELVEHSVFTYKGKNEHFIRLGHKRYKNGETKALIPKDTVTDSPPRMKSIARFKEEFAKKVVTLLKGGGNKELPSLFSTSPSAWDIE